MDSHAGQAVRTYTFYPERRRGTLFYGAALLLSLAALVTGVTLILNAEGLSFVGFLVLTLLGAVALPILGNALLGLYRAQYVFNRNSLRLQWGGRIENIPMEAIEWVRTFDSVGLELHVPQFYQFGIVRGVINQRELGAVEFMADTVRASILIATRSRVYVVSPIEVELFLAKIREAMESGSLEEAKPLSVVEETAIQGIWQQPIGRLLLVSLLVCNLALIVIVQLLVSTETGIRSFQQQTVVSLTSLRLLPYLSSTFGLVDLILGFFFYQAKKQPALAYLLWASGALLPVLFSVSLGLAL